MYFSLFPSGEHDDGKGEEEIKESSKAVAPTKADNTKDSLPPVHYSLRFDHLDLEQADRLWSASLKLYKRKVSIQSSDTSRGVNPVETVNVFQVIKRSTSTGVMKVYRPFATKNIRSESDGYVSFNITEGIKRWRQEESYQSQSLELDVIVDTPVIVRSGLNLPPIIAFDVPTYGKGETKKAQLVIETLSDRENLALSDSENMILNETESLTSVQSNSGHRRRKRIVSLSGVSSEYCLNRSDEANCCVRPASVDFHSDLNWNWVIRPYSFEPNYCSGRCQSTSWPHASMSSEYLTQLRLNNPTAAPEPCCVPHEMESITLITLRDKRLQIEEIPNMIVKSCICR